MFHGLFPRPKRKLSWNVSRKQKIVSWVVPAVPALPVQQTPSIL